MRSNKWLAAVGFVLLGILIGGFAYNAGLSEGAARAAAAAGTLPPYAYGWGWHRPWGFGFPILFFLFVWLVFARAFFWGGPWRRRWYYGPDDGPSSFDEWHRRAHERMSEQPKV